MLFLNYILKNEKATGLPIEIHKTRCVYVCEPAFQFTIYGEFNIPRY